MELIQYRERQLQFKIIRDEYYPNIITRFKFFIPAFQTSFDEQDGNHLVLAELASFIISNCYNTAIISKTAEFTNEALELGQSKTENAIVMEIFQPITSKSK